MTDVATRTDIAFTGGWPLIMMDTYVEINSINLSCLCLEVSLTAENKSVEVQTFCGVRDYPGPTKWHFVAKLAQSYYTASTYQALSDALNDWLGTGPDTPGVGCPYVVRPDGGNPASAANPEFSGMMIPIPFNLIGGAAGTLSEVDIDWTLTAQPSVATTLEQARENRALIGALPLSKPKNGAPAPAK